jgi:squalene-hopene/tetraprenyl-beta-curcumene cyclase
MDSIDPAALEETLANARRALLEARNANGHWEGELSSSALSTATAVFALSLHPNWRDHPLVARGLEWLEATQNPDGGWGDTVKSLSNISTTALCWAALAGKGAHERYGETIERAEKWLRQKSGSPHPSPEHRGRGNAPESGRSDAATVGVDPDHLIPAIIARYGKDHTFSVPILTMCALAGRLGEGRDAWKHIPQLPFELAACPQRWFKWLRLPVVSYALPALIAIGLVRHKHRPMRNPLTLAARRLARRRALILLDKIQPGSGGYLEATPLTSFVVMSLIGAGLADHPVVHRGIEFLVRSARSDGSWAIDTNLATWVTTLAVNALAIAPDFHQVLPEPERLKIRDWLLDQQYTTEHPYTLANPGGWAWTDLPGGVPDADDTAGALLALKHLGLIDDRTRRAAEMGVSWLLQLQNCDGGIPTFCRGWGRLPFDRSSADLSAHALRAWAAWMRELPPDAQSRIGKAMRRALLYLMRKARRTEPFWTPLWFGNQHAPDDINPTYGTARVLLACDVERGDYHPPHFWEAEIKLAMEWLVLSQNVDGGWGGHPGAPPSIEETALSVESLAASRQHAVPISRGKGKAGFEPSQVDTALARGVAWLIEHTRRGTRFDASPIGFYFAKLWYFEKLYPLIFTVAALNAVKVSMENNQKKTAKTRNREEDLRALL